MRDNLSQSVTIFGVWLVWAVVVSIWAITFVLVVAMRIGGFWLSYEFETDPDPPGAEASDPSEVAFPFVVSSSDEVLRCALPYSVPAV